MITNDKIEDSLLPTNFPNNTFIKIFGKASPIQSLRIDTCISMTLNE